MKERKIIIGLIILNLFTISIIFNLLVNRTINNQKQIVKRMSATEYDNSINLLNTSHTAYANSIEQNKINLANAITAKGITTATDADFDTIIKNIRNIQTSTTHTGTKTISSNTTTDLGAEHNIRYITTSIKNDFTISGTLSVSAGNWGSYSSGFSNSGPFTITCRNGVLSVNNGSVSCSGGGGAKDIYTTGSAGISGLSISY